MNTHPKAVTRSLWEERLPGRVEFEFPLSRLTSFRLGGPASILVEAESEADLELTSGLVKESPAQVLVLGRGSNLLISDRGYEGVVVRLGKGFDWVKGDEKHVEAGGMTPLPQVANRAAKLGLSGLEFAVAIPATVGGAVRMNAGAHGSSVSNVLDEASLFSIVSGTRRTMGPAELGMSYRETSVNEDSVVLSAKFLLSPEERGSIVKKMELYRDHRSTTQPLEPRNAGSMFKNPEGDAAGRLIEKAGLKGYRQGNAAVSSKHSNFFIALPGATAQDVYDLMAEVQRRVLQSLGTLLLPEVRIIGEFERAETLRSK